MASNKIFQKAEDWLDDLETVGNYAAEKIGSVTKDMPIVKSLGAIAANPTRQEIGAQVSNLASATNKGLQESFGGDPVDMALNYGPGTMGTIYKGFHGTRGKKIFTKFNTDTQMGAHFAEDPNIADIFTDPQLRMYGRRTDINDPALGWMVQGGRIYPSKLNIKNVLDFGDRDIGDWGNIEEVKRALVDMKVATRKELSKVHYQKDMQDFIKNKGYDGISYINQFEGLKSVPKENRKAYIVFDNTQISPIFGKAEDFLDQ